MGQLIVKLRKMRCLGVRMIVAKRGLCVGLINQRRNWLKACALVNDEHIWNV